MLSKPVETKAKTQIIIVAASFCRFLQAALLGSVAAMARWFGTEHFEVTVMDNGSGKLLNYLRPSL